MATKKKMLQAAAGQAGGAGLNVEDVFSTYLYEGTGSNITVTHNIDLSTEGGLVWVRPRISSNHWLWDSARGTQYSLATDNTALQTDMSPNGTVFNTDGFTDRMGWGSGTDIASWTFRKAPKFFTCLTYTGTGSAQNISHDLGSDVGFLLIKRTDSSGNWRCWHRGLPGTGSNMEFNQTGAYETSTTIFNGTDPTSTQFSVGTNSNVNASGGTYVAYLFAHNDGDGGFGADGDADIIKCGSYTSSNPTNRPEVDLGFEPQWLLIKNATASSNWMLVDNMRGLPVNGGDQTLAADSNAAENGIIGEPNAVALTPTGFKLTGGVTASNAGTGNTHIYIAIRRGTKVPEDADEVFAIDVRDDTDAPMYKSGFVTDFSLYRDKAGNDDWRVTSRLQGTGGTFPEISTAAESSAYTTSSWDWMNGFHDAGSVNTGYLSWMWKRAPGYFDAVAYTGNGISRTISHNLGVAPEMIWFKKRNASASWLVMNTHLTNPNDDYLVLDSDISKGSISGSWLTPTSTEFGIGFSFSETNRNGDDYIAYLFASLPGISKVGSYTGNGSSQTIDCGFTSGARFVLVKDTTGGNWFVYDSVRGITSGSDPALRLNLTNAEVSTTNAIAPNSSGFIVEAAVFNNSGDSYIFYAIA